MRWNGVEIGPAPKIRHLTAWERFNNALEDRALPAILPCLLFGTIAGLQFA